MASVQNQEFNFPHYPLPPPPQHHPSPPRWAPPPPPRVAPPPHPISPSPPLPPPHSSPPPVPIVKPPPPPPRHKSSPPPAIVPPPPHHPIHPPPPHIVPSPPPPAPPGHHSTVIIVVFVSLGGLLFLAFLAVALMCFIRKRKKKMAQETDIVNIDEHIKIQEAVIPGPNGPRVVVLSTEKDVHIQEEIKKNEVTESSHVRSAAQDNHERLGGKPAATFEPSHYLLEHKA